MDWMEYRGKQWELAAWEHCLVGGDDPKEHAA